AAGSSGPKESGCSASTCFCVDDGEGFEVKVSQPTSITVDGCESQVPISLPASPGQRYLFSVPYQTSLVTCADLVAAIGLPSTGLLSQRGTVTRADCATGAFTTAIAGTSACASLTLVAGEAVGVAWPSSPSSLNFTNPTTAVGPCGCDPNFSVDSWVT